MNVINISTDRKIFEPGSAVRARMIEYGAYFNELHIIIFSKKAFNFKEEQIAPSVWIYPTSSWSKFFYTKDAYRKAHTIIQDRNFRQSQAVITCQDPFETGRVGIALKKKFSIALQIQIHTDFLSPYFKKESLLNRMRVVMARHAVPYADELRVVSKRIKESILKLGIQESKIDILPIFTDVTKYLNSEINSDINSDQNLKKKYPQFEIIILMASRLTPEKNISFALLVFREILRKHPTAGLIIVGEGREKSRLSVEVKKLSLERNVIFEPWQHDVHTYFKTCDIFLLTSHYEGYGLTLVEAGLSGAPIVTSDVGIAGEILHDGINSSVCAIEDMHGFIHALDMLILDKNLRHTYSEKIRSDIQQALVELGTKESYLKRYAELLDKARTLHS